MFLNLNSHMVFMLVLKIERISQFVAKDSSKIREICKMECASLAEAVVSVGERTKKHRHMRSDEIYFILEGQGRMEVEEEREEVSAGEAILIRKGEAHCIENIGTAPLRFLCICSPPYSDEDTLLEHE